jgi:hypothetical protein
MILAWFWYYLKVLIMASVWTGACYYLIPLLGMEHNYVSVTLVTVPLVLYFVLEWILRPIPPNRITIQ